MDLGTVGVWTTYRAIGEENAGEAAGLVERLGYGTFWLGGSPLARDFPERVLVGIGIGHPEATSDYSRPLTAMRGFLDGLDHADTPLPRSTRSPRARKYPVELLGRATRLVFESGRPVRTSLLIWDCRRRGWGSADDPLLAEFAADARSCSWYGIGSRCQQVGNTASRRVTSAV
jgi:hypothetical protein